VRLLWRLREYLRTAPVTTGSLCWCGHDWFSHFGDDAECLACDHEGKACYGHRPPPAAPRPSPWVDE
jgi:hypothetical protein